MVIVYLKTQFFGSVEIQASTNIELNRIYLIRTRIATLLDVSKIANLKEDDVTLWLDSSSRKCTIQINHDEPFKGILSDIIVDDSKGLDYVVNKLQSKE